MNRVDELLARQYAFRAVVEPTGGWSIVFPDLPGCVSYAESWEVIGPQARTAFALWMESEHEQGHEISAPTIGDAAPAFPAEAFDVSSSMELLTAQDVAAELGITTRRVNALANRTRRRTAPRQEPRLLARRPGQRAPTFAWPSCQAATGRSCPGLSCVAVAADRSIRPAPPAVRRVDRGSRPSPPRARSPARAGRPAARPGRG